LLLARRFATGKGAEDVVIIDNAILVDFDKAGAAVRVRGLEHIRQILVHVDAAGDEPRARTEREHARRHRPVDRAERS
jgi:hypothetical protein